MRPNPVLGAPLRSLMAVFVCRLYKLIQVCSLFEVEHNNMAENLNVIVRRITSQGVDAFTCDYKTFGLPSQRRHCHFNRIHCH
jgi:hypothetical protein